MKRRKWMIIAIVAATVILLAGVIGGVAYAQTATTGGTAGKTLMARVATIMGVDQAKLENAFKQAQKEMQDEALSARLKNLVDQGELTQQQADQYKQWAKSRPDIPQLGPGGPGFKGGFRGMPGPRGFMIPQAPPAPPATSAAPKTN